MRSLVSLALILSFSPLLALAASQNTNADSNLSISIAEPLQKKLAASYGSAEAQVLQQAINDSVARAVQRAGLAPAALPRTEVLLSDARPSHPTHHQQGANPSIDPVRSISLGGATLSAVLRGADGKELERVSADHYANSLQEASASLDTWSDARLSIDRLADQLVKAYRGHAH